MVRKNHINAIHVFGIIIIICTILCFYYIVKHKNATAKYEPYYGFNKSQVQGEVASLEPVGTKCKNARSPMEVCLNYNACCGETAIPGSCVCQNPVVSQCRENYTKCLQDKYLSAKSMDFIGLDNKAKACETILKSCCKTLSGNASSKNSMANDQEFRRLTMHADAPDSRVICSSDSLADCKTMCIGDDNCKSIIYNSAEGTCFLYDKPLVPKAKVYANSDSNFIQLEKRSDGRIEGYRDSDRRRSEGFRDSAGYTGFHGMWNNKCPTTADRLDNFADIPVTGTGVAGVGAANVCRDFDTKCAGLGADSECLCKNPVVMDCQQNYKNCLAKNPGKIAICKTMFGACCGILDEIADNPELKQRFNMDKPPGAGMGGQVSEMVCRPVVRDLDECKQKCRMNPDCNYVETNFGLTEKESTEARYCKLFKGKPRPVNSPSFGTPVTHNIIYKKQVVDLDSAEAE